MEKDNLITETSEKYPFLTGISYAGQEYVGVVVNHDNTILTFYDIEKERSVNLETLSNKESQKLLNNNYQKQQEQGSTLAFKLAKETEQYELQNRKLMSKFRQLMN